MARAVLTKLLLAAGLTGLLTWGASLDAADADRRSLSLSVEPLVPVAERTAMRVAAVTLERAGRSHFYARRGGHWRCLSLFDADVRAGDLQRLVDTALNASGVVQSVDPERFADYDIGNDACWTVTLHGGAVLKDEDRDVLFALELGDALPSLNAGFARVVGDDRVLLLDSDPRDSFAPGGRIGGAVPLIDPHVMPEYWPPAGQRVDRVVVERVGVLPYYIELRDVETTEEERSAGKAPFEWVTVHQGGSESTPSPDHAIAYSVFLRLATIVGVDDGVKAADYGLEQGSFVGRVGLRTSAGEELNLLFGRALADGRVPMLTTLARPVLFVTGEMAELFLPASEALDDPVADNPWEPFLMEASRTMLEATTSRVPR